MKVTAIAKIGILVATFAFGFLALTFADASAPDVGQDLGPMVLLTLAFFATLGMLVNASLALDIRLSTQVLLIYLAIYLILPGYNHNSANLFPFFSLSYPLQIRFDAALAVLLFVVSFSIGTLMITLRPSLASLSLDKDFLKTALIGPNSRLALGVTVISGAATVVYISGVGVQFAFATRVVESSLYLSKTNAGLIVALPRVLTLVALTYSLVLIKFSTKPRIGWRLLIVNLPFILVTNYPPALPRSQLFGIALVVSVFLANYAKIRARAILSIAFVGGATIGMPLLDHFTRGQGSLATLDMRNIFSAYFRSGDFDGFQSVVNAVVYVESNGLEYGHQLISAILFFVPRAIWTGKAEPSGSIAADAAGYTFLNVSMPLPGEMYIDFGMAGTVGMGILIGVGIALLDRQIDRMWRHDLHARLIAAAMVGYTLPLYRGSLLGVIAPFATIAVAFWLIGQLGLKPPKLLRSNRTKPSHASRDRAM